MEKLGILCFNDDDTTSAKIWWTKAANLGSIFAMELLGRLYSKEHQIDQAVEWLTKSSESEFVFPKINARSRDSYWYDAGSPYHQLGNLFMRVGDFQSALIWFKKDLERGVNGANYVIGDCYLELNDLQNSEIFYSEARNAGFVAGNAGIGEIRILQNRLDEAQEIFEEIIYFGNSNPLHTLKLAEVLLKISEKSRAFELAKKSFSDINTEIYNIHSDPKRYHIDEVAWITQKIVHEVIVFEGNLKHTDLKKLPEIVNETTNAISNLGIFYYRHNMVDKAEVNLIKALHRKDKFAEAEASYFLAEIYQKTGKTEESRQYQERCEKAGGYIPVKSISTLNKSIKVRNTIYYSRYLLFIHLLHPLHLLLIVV